MPPAIKTIILINVAVFFLQFFTPFGAMIQNLGALWPVGSENFRLWQPVTYMFLHGGGTHLFFNMFALYMFGPYLEYKIGGKRFLLLYFTAGIIGNIGYALLSPSAFIPGLGASGAIYGIMAALAMLEPNLEVYLFFITPLPLWIVMFFWALVNLWGTLSLAGGIGYSAHLAGGLAGVVYAYWLKKKNAKLLDSYGLDY